ncbi:hypothetical protein GF325_17025, partial [Candidatus Bathyarchaeota archaeon]|nr:hypothetical protein [Candidatus Bathyarchaeota archaeon]
YPRFKFKELQERINLIHAEEIPILRKYLNYDGINFERISREIAYIVKTISRYEGEMDRIRNKIFLKIAATLEIIDNLKEYIWAMQQFNEISTSRIKLSFFVPTREKDRIYTDLERDFSPSITLTMHDVKKHAGIDWNKKKEIIPENRMKDDGNNDAIAGMTSGEKNSSLDERVGNLKRMKSESPIEVSQDSESVMGRRDSPKVEEEDIRTDTPTLMNHSGIVKPFETITKMFGTPAYSEIDPTPIIAVTLPLLFGLMFGDIGHGLCLMISGLIGVRIFKRKGEKGNTMVGFAWIVFHFGWGAIIGGILYGEFFGMHDILGFHLQPLHFGSFTLHSPLNNILSIFKFTLIVGVVQINLGWTIQFLNYWRNKRKYMAFFDSFMKICILSGGTFVIFMHGFNINAWLNPPFPILLPVIPGIMLIISKPLGKLFKISYLEHEKTGELLSEGFMETFETVLSIMSNVASYVRILALALAHISLMICIDETVQLIPQEGAFSQVVRLAVAIGGNIIVIALEGILVMINNIRLHFYEFFFKFYQGNGIEFSPFNLNYNICEITLMKTKEKDVISEELTKQIAIEFDQDELEKARIHLQKQYGA